MTCIILIVLFTVSMGLMAYTLMETNQSHFSRLRLIVVIACAILALADFALIKYMPSLLAGSAGSTSVVSTTVPR